MKFNRKINLLKYQKSAKLKMYEDYLRLIIHCKMDALVHIGIITFSCIIFYI